jgi:hypothetical protein
MKIFYLLLICLVLVSISISCGASLTETVLTQDEVSGVNCLAGDVAGERPFTVVGEETAVPVIVPFADVVTAYHRVSLAERQLANIDARCEMMVYGDVETAESALEAFCAVGEGEAIEVEFGELACGFKSVGLREVHFRRGQVVVSILEDSDGLDVEAWAAAVDGRLNT